MICTLLTVALSVIRRSSDLTNSSATSSSLTSALGRSTLNLCACKPPSFEKVTAASNTARYCVMPTRYQPAAWREPDRFRREVARDRPRDAGSDQAQWWGIDVDHSPMRTPGEIAARTAKDTEATTIAHDVAKKHNRTRNLDR